MLNRILTFIKKFIPKKVFRFFQPAYHWLLAQASALIYDYPSEEMIVIGVTGTAGKSSTCYFMAQILEQAGFKVGMTTTTLFKIADKEWLNDSKMTMLGRFQLQKLLRKMVNKNCEVAIIETSSQGIEQFRHIGINYDILVFTNLYPEHIEAHGGFENYKRAKGKLFQYLSSCGKKKLSALNIKETRSKKQETKDLFEKVIIVNADDEHADYFLSFDAEQKVIFHKKQETRNNFQINFKSQISNIITDENLKINLFGDYNVYNVLAGVSVGKVFGIDENKILSAVKNLKPMPGRLEFIANNLGIKILIDYAFEPKALQKLYETIEEVEHNKIISILGSAGGGRDKARRPKLGKIANENADVVIVTNEDPYDESPQEIIDQVAEPVQKDKLFKILDRREAIKKALELASKGDLILITGKGAEQGMCVENGKILKWDDREVVREIIQNLKVKS